MKKSKIRSRFFGPAFLSVFLLATVVVSVLYSYGYRFDFSFGDAQFSPNYRLRPMKKIDSDQYADIIWRNKKTGHVIGWLLEKGKYIKEVELDRYDRISPHVLLPEYPVPPYEVDTSDMNWQLVGVSEFSGFNTYNLVWQNKIKNKIYAWVMDFDSLYDIMQFDPSGLGLDNTWNIVGFGDFDRDYRYDMVVQQKATGFAKIIFLTVYNPVSILRESYIMNDQNLQKKKIVGVGDFNNDYKNDIVLRDDVSGDIEVRQIERGSTAIGKFPRPANSNWMLVDIEDYNNDAKLDLLWRNMATGANSIWYMDGVKRIGTSTIKGMSDLNWEVQN